MNVRPPQVNGGVPSLADASDNESPRPEATRTMRALAALGVFPGSADQVHRARRFTAGLLDGLYIADDAVICVSELATNAVLHSASREAGGTFSVHLETIPTGYIRIAVRDEGGPWARREHNDGRAHGLDIVAQLASDFGVGGDADHGWTVWARLNMTESLTELPGSAANGHAGRERADADATSGVMLTLADELTAQGLDVWSPRWDGSEYLKLTNVPQALGEVTVSDGGLVIWEYHPFHGNSPDPNRMTRMVLAVLCADQATIGRSTIAAPRRDRPLTDNVGRSLTEQGIQTTPKTFDAGHYGSYTEIEAVNPALPARGRVLIADDGMLRWECSLDVPTEIQGIDLPEIASTISKVLVVDGEPESPRVKTRNRPEHRRCIRHL